MSVTRSSNWRIHLPAGVDPAELDLLAAGSLPAAWRRLASEDPGRPTLDATRDHQATLFFGVPTMYARLADSPRAGELGRLRLCVSGSAPLPPTVFQRLAERAGQRVLERYGMTETIMNVSNPYDGERRPGTVGLPLPGVELRLAGGEQGEILLRGPNVFGGYWGNAEATAAAFDPDGT